MGDVCEMKSPAPCPARFILQSNVVLGYQVWEMLARKPFGDVSNVHKQGIAESHYRVCKLQVHVCS